MEIIKTIRSEVERLMELLPIKLKPNFKETFFKVGVR